jgi:hypothetical protein
MMTGKPRVGRLSHAHPIGADCRTISLPLASALCHDLSRSPARTQPGTHPRPLRRRRGPTHPSHCGKTAVQHIID